MLLKTLASLSICVFSFVYSEIIECPHFKNIYSYIDAETLIILDIDDTLLIPKQMLGSDEWFCHRIKFYKEQGLNKEESLEKALAEWEGIRHLSQMQLVEPLTDTIIADLQAKGHMIMGLTTQGLGLATRTYLQLKEQGIDLSTTAPYKQDCFFLNQNHGILFRNGILFTSGQSKGICFETLCEIVNTHPKKIVFVNDKATHLKDLEQYAMKKGIPFMGLRYSYSDFRKEAFDPKLADYQYKHSSFAEFLTDDKAKEALSR